MKCKECGGELPYDTYGRIKCDFCNTQNYVPIPEKSGVVKEKTEGDKVDSGVWKKKTPYERADKLTKIIVNVGGLIAIAGLYSRSSIPVAIGFLVLFLGIARMIIKKDKES